MTSFTYQAFSSKTLKFLTSSSMDQVWPVSQGSWSGEKSQPHTTSHRWMGYLTLPLRPCPLCHGAILLSIMPCRGPSPHSWRHFREPHQPTSFSPSSLQLPSQIFSTPAVFCRTLLVWKKQPGCFISHKQSQASHSIMVDWIPMAWAWKDLA